MGSGISAHNVPKEQRRELYDKINQHLSANDIKLESLAPPQLEVYEELRKEFGGESGSQRRSSASARRRRSQANKVADEEERKGSDGEPKDRPAARVAAGGRRSLLRPHLTGLDDDNCPASASASGGSRAAADAAEELSVGDVVKALDAELGMWFEGLLLAIHDADTYDVDLQDHTITVSRSAIRRVRPWSCLELGDIVECRLPGLGALWFRAQVMDQSADGSRFSVHVDGDEDGDIVEGIPRIDIRKLLSGRSAAAAARRWRAAAHVVGMVGMVARSASTTGNGDESEGYYNEPQEEEEGGEILRKKLDPELHSELGEPLAMQQDLYRILRSSSQSQSVVSESGSVASVPAAPLSDDGGGDSGRREDADDAGHSRRGSSASATRCDAKQD